MEEYIKTLLAQIRCKKAHMGIESELRNHIEDQIADNINVGMDRKAAEDAAVKDMGDPVEVGISMDRIHRPKLAWHMLIYIACISSFGILIHYLICKKMERFNSQTGMGSSSFAFSVLLGLLVMFALCFIDYAVLAKFAKLIAAAMLALCLYSVYEGVRVNGTVLYVGFGSARTTLFSVMLLYAPVYGAVLYKYHGSGYIGFLKSIVWLVVPVFLVLRLPGVMLAAVLFVTLLMELSIAVIKGWFHIPVKRTLGVMWGITAFLPVFFLTVGMRFLYPYQAKRLLAFFTNGEENWLTAKLRAYQASGMLLGQNESFAPDSLPGFNSDYILTYLMQSYGILISVAVCCVIGIFLAWLLSSVLRQKNQLGAVVGCGCVMVLLLNFVVNILENMGCIPVSQTYLPFMSAGGSTIVATYALVGIVLSIYRYKNVYPENVDVKLSKLKVNIDIQN